jgi:hypothetical protein
MERKVLNSSVIKGAVLFAVLLIGAAFIWGIPMVLAILLLVPWVR